MTNRMVLPKVIEPVFVFILPWPYSWWLSACFNRTIEGNILRQILLPVSIISGYYIYYYLLSITKGYYITYYSTFVCMNKHNGCAYSCEVEKHEDFMHKKLWNYT